MSDRLSQVSPSLCEIYVVHAEFFRLPGCFRHVTPDNEILLSVRLWRTSYEATAETEISVATQQSPWSQFPGEACSSETIFCRDKTLRLRSAESCANPEEVWNLINTELDTQGHGGTCYDYSLSTEENKLLSKKFLLLRKFMCDPFESQNTIISLDML